MRHAQLALAACLLTSLVASVARAEKPDPEVKAVLDTQVKAIPDGDDAAFLATFRPDAVVWVADHAAPVDKLEALRQAFKETWVERVDAPQKVKASNVNAIALSGNMALLSAELAMSAKVEGERVTNITWNVRVTEVLVRAEDGSGPWLVQAAHFSLPREDKHVFQQAANGGYDDPQPELPGGAAVNAKWVGEWFTDGSKWVTAKTPWTTVFGTAPKERAVGAKKAAALVKAWKKVKFEIVGNVRAGEAFPCYWMMANVNATFIIKKKPVVLRFRLLLVMLEEQESGELSVIAAHFGAP